MREATGVRRMLCWLAALALAGWLATGVAQQSALEVITLKYRTADQVIPVLKPLLAPGGTIDWKKTMELLRSRQDQYPLLLELREVPEFPNPIAAAKEVFERLENL